MAEEINEVLEQDAEQEVQQPIVITLEDLKNYRILIDIAIARSAYRPLELEDVGKLYKKLDAFINAAEQQMERSKQEAEAGSNAESTPSEE